MSSGPSEGCATPGTNRFADALHANRRGWPSSIVRQAMSIGFFRPFRAATTLFRLFALIASAASLASTQASERSAAANSIPRSTNIEEVAASAQLPGKLARTQCGRAVNFLIVVSGGPSEPSMGVSQSRFEEPPLVATKQAVGFDVKSFAGPPVECQGLADIPPRLYARGSGSRLRAGAPSREDSPAAPRLPAWRT